MSTELRTPLNVVLGFGQLLEADRERLTRDQTEWAGHILLAGRRLLAPVGVASENGKNCTLSSWECSKALKLARFLPPERDHPGNWCVPHPAEDDFPASGQHGGSHSARGLLKTTSHRLSVRFLPFSDAPPIWAETLRGIVLNAAEKSHADVDTRRNLMRAANSLAAFSTIQWQLSPM